jgi:hypothetical protein
MSKFDGVLGRSDKPTKAGPTGPSTRGKSTDPNYQKTTVYLSKDLHRNVKIACLKTNPPLDMSDVIEQQLANWLKAQPARPLRG